VLIENFAEASRAEDEADMLEAENTNSALALRYEKESRHVSFVGQFFHILFSCVSSDVFESTDSAVSLRYEKIVNLCLFLVILFTS